MLPRVYADFQNADAQGRVRLNCRGTVLDLQRQQIELRSNLALLLYSDDGGQATELEAEGVSEFSAEEQCWVAAIDWSAIRQVTPTSSSVSVMTLPTGIHLPVEGGPSKAS